MHQSVKTGTSNQPRAENQQELQQLASRVFDSRQARLSQQDFYLTVDLNSFCGFKIQFKFSQNLITMIMKLLHYNGKPIFIPQLYKQPLLKKMKQKIYSNLDLTFSLQNNTLVIENGVKFTEKDFSIASSLTKQFQNLLPFLRTIQKLLSRIGIIKKNKISNYKLLITRLQLIKKIVSILKQKQNQQIISNNNQPKNPQSLKKSSVFKYYKNIKVIQENKPQDISKTTQRKKSQIKSGGFFQVQKRQCIVTSSNDGERKEQTLKINLAQKKIKKELQHESYCQKKLKKQIRILNQIKDPKYSLNYWIDENDRLKVENGQNQDIKKLYMQFVQQTLDDKIYQTKNSMTDILSYSRQILGAVQNLHECGIVHRDLKPENFLVKTIKSTSYDLKINMIKVIDYGESALTSDIFSNSSMNFLGCTLPYSPIECSFSCQQGFNSKKIDIWSVGVVLYQLVFKSIPLYYSKSLSSDILKGWKIPQQFNFLANTTKRHGCRIIESIYAILALNTVCINQKERLSIEKILKIVKLVEAFMKSMLTMQKRASNPQ